jgi:hypothetical protein
MSKIQEVARHSRTAVSGYSAATLLWSEGRVARSAASARSQPLRSLRTVRDQKATSPARAPRDEGRALQTIFAVPLDIFKAAGSLDDNKCTWRGC